MKPRPLTRREQKPRQQKVAEERRGRENENENGTVVVEIVRLCETCASSPEFKYRPHHSSVAASNIVTSSRPVSRLPLPLDFRDMRSKVNMHGIDSSRKCKAKEMVREKKGKQVVKKKNIGVVMGGAGVPLRGNSSSSSLSSSTCPYPPYPVHSGYWRPEIAKPQRDLRRCPLRPALVQLKMMYPAEDCPR